MDARMEVDAIDTVLIVIAVVLIFLGVAHFVLSLTGIELVGAGLLGLVFGWLGGLVRSSSS